MRGLGVCSYSCVHSLSKLPAPCPSDFLLSLKLSWHHHLHSLPAALPSAKRKPASSGRARLYEGRGSSDLALAYEEFVFKVRMLKGLRSEPLPSRGFCLKADCDEIEPGAQRRHVDALEYPRQEKASTVERGGHRVLGSEANISAICCRAYPYPPNLLAGALSETRP